MKGSKLDQAIEKLAKQMGAMVDQTTDGVESPMTKIARYNPKHASKPHKQPSYKQIQGKRHAMGPLHPMQKARVDEKMKPRQVAARREAAAKERAEGHEVGVHDPIVTSARTGHAESGRSTMGSKAATSNIPRASAKDYNIVSDREFEARRMARKKLQELRAMKKPNLPKSETDELEKRRKKIPELFWGDQDDDMKDMRATRKSFRKKQD